MIYEWPKSCCMNYSSTAWIKRHYEFLPFHFFHYTLSKVYRIIDEWNFCLLAGVFSWWTYFAGTLLFNLVTYPFLFVIRAASRNLQKWAAPSWECTSHLFNQSVIFTCCSAWNVMSRKKYALTVPTLTCFLVCIMEINNSISITPCICYFIYHSCNLVRLLHYHIATLGYFPLFQIFLFVDYRGIHNFYRLFLLCWCKNANGAL